MARPRLLLIPTLTELEWVIKPDLEEWAEVASYDVPGVGDEPAVDGLDARAVARRGIEEADRRGWQRFFVVADEWAVLTASHVAALAPARVDGLALGHARLSNSPDQPRPAINAEILDVIRNLSRTDRRTYVQQLFKGTRGQAAAGGYQDDLVDEYVHRVPLAIAQRLDRWLIEEGEGLGERLMHLGVPMLLAQHRGCVMFTSEGFDDAVAAFPDAQVERFDEKPSTSPEFAQVLREFCARLATTQA